MVVDARGLKLENGLKRVGFSGEINGILGNNWLIFIKIFNQVKLKYNI